MREAERKSALGCKSVPPPALCGCSPLDDLHGVQKATVALLELASAESHHGKGVSPLQLG